jgi:hypothetical protein
MSTRKGGIMKKKRGRPPKKKNGRPKIPKVIIEIRVRR